MPVTGELGEKLSVIMETTREYVSGSSASSGATRTGFTITRDDMPTIKEQTTIDGMPFSSNYIGSFLTFSPRHRFISTNFRLFEFVTIAMTLSLKKINVDRCMPDYSQ